MLLQPCKPRKRFPTTQHGPGLEKGVSEETFSCFHFHTLTLCPCQDVTTVQLLPSLDTHRILWGDGSKCVGLGGRGLNLGAGDPEAARQWAVWRPTFSFCRGPVTATASSPLVTAVSAGRDKVRAPLKDTGSPSFKKLQLPEMQPKRSRGRERQRGGHRGKVVSALESYQIKHREDWSLSSVVLMCVWPKSLLRISGLYKV